MTDLKRCGSLAAAFLLAATLLSGCASTGDDGIAANAQPNQLTPVADSSVNSASLPPIGPDGSVQVAGATPADPSTTTPDTGDPGLQIGAAPGTPPTQTASAGSFVTLNDVGTVPNGSGRNLAGGLSIEKLLGGWTVVGGATQCHLNLTYTTKTGTDRYRASSPGCQISGLAVVSSWQLSGTQIQLFDDSNKLVGALLLSGNRFIGTLSGGQSISMVG